MRVIKFIPSLQNISHRFSFRAKKYLLLTFLMTVCALPQTIFGQQREASSSPTPGVTAERAETQSQTANASTDAALPASASASIVDVYEPYQIGVGDVIEIRVFDRPQLSLEAVRVDGRGMIRMPLIEEDIQAACRTESELARYIAKLYLEYQTDPQVNVFIKEYNSQPAAVIGAVNSPGRFQMQRRVRLLELLTFAGGPNDRAGRNIQVVHATPALACKTSPNAATNMKVMYNLDDTLNGNAEDNPYVQPGDIITIAEAEQIFVIGDVISPATIALKEPLTVSRAIAMAGGTGREAKEDKIRIIRRTPGSTTNTEFIVNLNAIEKRQAEDTILLAGDVVDVPTSGKKVFINRLTGAIAPALITLPVRVIR